MIITVTKTSSTRKLTTTTTTHTHTQLHAGHVTPNRTTKTHVHPSIITLLCTIPKLGKIYL